MTNGPKAVAGDREASTVCRMPTRREALTAGAKAAIGTACCGVLGAREDRAHAAVARPGPRAGHALAYHAGLGAMCLIGGDDAGPDRPREEPWLWNGRTWTMRRMADGPGVTSLVAATSDPERKSVLVFGGFSVLGQHRYGPPMGELWELTAEGAWRPHHGGGPEPGPRHHHAAAFDSARGRLVLYGGIDATDSWVRDVWEWDRTRWHRIQTPTGPGERAHHALSYDSTRGRVVLRGGTHASKERPTDTWEWDGKAWHQAATDGPDPGGGYRMAYDAERAVTVLFGGNTCLWDGARWTRAEASPSPAPRTVHALAYDPARKRVVLYGGTVDQKDVGDTWEWDGGHWREL